MFSSDNSLPRSNGCAITLRAHKLDLDPVLFVASVIAQERWQIVHIQNQRIHVAVIVVISESRAAARKMFGNAGPHLRRNILEASIAEILVDQARVLEGLIEMVVVNLRVNVSIHLKDVLPAIIVIVNKRASPCDIAVVDSNTGSERNVGESPIAVVVEQVAGVVSEVGFENVEPAVALVLRDGDTHPSLLMAALAAG